MADTNTLHFTEGDKIKFTHYSNIDPRPVCVGTVEKVYGSSLVGALTKSYQMDVKIEDVLNNHWAKDMLVGKTVRLQVRSDSDIVKLDEAVVGSKEKLKEEGIFRKSPSLSNDGDERLAVNKAIHELTEAASILNKFLENGMVEKRLLEMADTYCQRGYSHIANLIKLAN